jgi:hypothetical protein
MCREPDAFLHQVVGGRWRLLEVLGPTEHGAVFRAESLEDGRMARLELWDPRHVERRGELARFEREARTLSRLRHERCLSIVAFGAHEGRPFLVSELPEARALKDQLGKPELTVARAISLGLQLCEGLRHLHGHGVVHRALRAENVWVALSAGGELLKLGLPRVGQTVPASDPPPERLYLPPERSTGRMDHRADLYAAGMLLYVMCTGREPSGEVTTATAGGTAVPPPRVVSPERRVSEALERVILRAVAPSPDVRFETVDELIAALQAAGARQTSPPRRPAQRPRKKTAVVATAFATVALLCAGALHSSGGQGPSAAPAEQAPRIPEPAAADRAGAPATAPLGPAPVPRREAAALPRPATAGPPVEPAPEAAPPAVAPRPAPISAKASGAPAHDERSEIWTLLESGRVDESAARIKSLLAGDPEAAWPRFALGVLYYQKRWRPDSVRQWRLALSQDPELRRDPQFGAYLCFMLDDAWQAAGMSELLTQLGAEAVPLLERCAASAKTARLRSFASRALGRLRGADQRPRR